MPCPAPPGFFQLIALYSGWPWLGVICAAGLLLLLGWQILILRSDARILLPGPAQRSVLALRGLGMLLLIAGYPSLFLSGVWRLGADTWFASLSEECQMPSMQALIGQAITVSIWDGVMGLLFISGLILLLLGTRKRRLTQAARHSE